MVKNQASQVIGAQMVNATTGAAFSGTVTVYVTGDGGTQAIGSVGSGLCTSEGNGYYTYLPSQAETNYDLIAFTFIGTGAIPATIQVATITISQSTALNVSGSGAAITALQLITAALKRIGVVGAGQTPSAEDASDALLRLNAMLDSFATERLLVPCIVRTTWTIVSGTGSYTIGVGGDVNVARPVFVQDIRFIDTSQDPDLELGLTMLTDQSYASIPQKALTSTYPQCFYYNPTFTGVGLASVTFWPVPTSSTLLGCLYAPTALTQVSALSSTLVFQPGIRWFLQECLAVALAPEFGVRVDPELKQSALDAKANYKRSNIRLVEMATTEGNYFGSRAPYNIWSDL